MLTITTDKSLEMGKVVDSSSVYYPNAESREVHASIGGAMLRSVYKYYTEGMTPLDEPWRHLRFGG